MRDGAVTLNLALSGVDLARIQSTLIATRLAGSVTGEVSQQRQVLRGDVRDAARGVALAFAGSVEDRRVTLDRLQVRAGAGEVSGTGSIALDGARAFTMTARATRFDPSRIVASLPPARARRHGHGAGHARPRVGRDGRARARAGQPRRGHAGQRNRARPRDADDGEGRRRRRAHRRPRRSGSTGALGAPADTLAYALDAPRLSDLKPLLARHGNVAVPEPFSGALRARGTVTGDPRSPGVTVDAHGEALHWGPRIGAVDARRRGDGGAGRERRRPGRHRRAPGDDQGYRHGRDDAASRRSRRCARASRARSRSTRDRSPRRATTSTSRPRSAAACRPASAPDGTQETAWVGAIDALANRGAFALKLEAPAPLEIARDRIRVGAARIAVAEGRADLSYLAVYEGRIATQGSFTGIPFTALARLSGTTLPFPSTLVLGGDWSLAAAPRLNGTVSVRRESGDWFATESATLDPADLALGISELALSARFAEDALTATGALSLGARGHGGRDRDARAGQRAGTPVDDRGDDGDAHGGTRVAAAAAAVDRHRGRDGRPRARRRRRARARSRSRSSPAPSPATRCASTCPSTACT